ncbi:hypothetical protein A1O1_05599 [Capronia coronata CBS 617.96]|uniref:Uncharacterized protein n=1 Tax=Capronia coronata CBS 617.96 TaxID=1182541 RepID=W9Y805_9EURO|nr:uncharacterized protein A1O1_05599 [Capronia coronata CBS 617.96]EXJ88668.1 hypothetical protein A1O1_05599 [Capronia coronata CBS 617.96]
MAELGHMLDNAIDDQSMMPGIVSAELSDEATSGPYPPKRSEMSQMLRNQSHSRSHKSRRSTESAVPRSSEDSARVNYAELPLPLPQLISKPTTHENAPGDKQDANVLSTEVRPKLSHESQSSRNLLEFRQHPSIHPDQKLSPVKQRAAMFESLVVKPSQHQQECQHFPPERDDAQGESLSRKDTKKVARIKFGDTIEERPATPLIPLTLPTMVSTQQTSSGSSSVMTTEPPPSEHTVSEDDKLTENAEHNRKPSMTWPFKWSIFNKAPTVRLQDSEPAPVEDAVKDEQHTGVKPSTVKSIVQDLLQAANQKDNAEKHRRHSEMERLSRRQSRPPPLVKESELSEDKVDLEDLKPANVPPLQLPIQEETEGLGPVTKTKDTFAEPRTPLQRAMTEKQVLSPPDRLETLNESSSSPRKADPSTPVRGRSRKSTHRLSVGEHRGVEQRFNLSQGSSRSRSRSGRAGVKVEVEVRDSPEREARSKGEKIVIIRANVEAVESDG